MTLFGMHDKYILQGKFGKEKNKLNRQFHNELSCFGWQNMKSEGYE